MLGSFAVGLLDELGHPEGVGGDFVTDPDVAEAGVGAVRHNPEGDEAAFLGVGEGGEHRFLEGDLVLDDVVGGSEQQHRVVPLLEGRHSSGGHGGSGVASGVLLDDELGGDAEVGELRHHLRAVSNVAHDDGGVSLGEAAKAGRRLLQQRVVAVVRDELLGCQLAGAGP